MVTIVNNIVYILNFFAKRIDLDFSYHKRKQEGGKKLSKVSNSFIV